MTNRSQKVWFIMGSSTGFGRSLTKAVLQHSEHSAERSYRVIATARKPEQLDDLVKQLDAWREVSVNTAFEGAELAAIGG